MSHGPTKREVLGALLQGLLWGGLFCLFVAWTSRYVLPARVSQGSAASTLRPLVEGGFIKVPLDIVRTRECLGQATITLRREHDYGPALGTRQDVVTLELYNTTITGLGEQKVMLWFRKPVGLFGLWDWDAKAQDDCGGVLEASNGKPRTAEAKAIDLGPEP